jgi:hypothetical protein
MHLDWLFSKSSDDYILNQTSRMQYIASVGSGQQHEKAAKVLLTT